MKQRLYLLFTLLVTAWLSATAYDFMVDGIAYNINSDNASVSVTYTEYFTTNNYSNLSGNLSIPASVQHNGKNYPVTAIDNNTFTYCSRLTSIKIPVSVTKIGDSAFLGCSKLTSINIPHSVTYIGWLVFQECSALTSIIVESGNNIYDSRNNCNAIIETVSNRLITGCMNTIIPNSVSEIGIGAFYLCSKLKSITIPNSVTSIEDDAFNGCDGLSEIISLNPQPPIVGWYVFYGVEKSIPVYVPKQSLSKYKATNGWKDFSNIKGYDIKAETITLNRTKLELNNGQSETLIANITPSNADNKSVIWKSSNTAVAIVENGKVTGIATGTATITASTTDGSNLAAKCTVIVSTLAKSISLSKTAITLNDGQSETLVASVTPTNTANKSVTWKSSNTAIAQVDTAGKVTAIAPGNATITATTTDGTNLSATCQVDVLMTAKGISLNKTLLNLNDGQSETLVATVTPSNTSSKSVIWFSSNTAIVSVNGNGQVTGVAPGTAIITATTTDGTNLSASCQVTVSMLAKGIILSNKKLVLNNGQTEKLVATVTPDNTTNKSVIWSSNDMAIATIDGEGNVTGINEGTTWIVATTNDGSNLSDTCEVTVNTNKLYTDVIDFYGGEETIVAVRMKNMVAVTGFQTDIRLPEGCDFVVDQDGYFDITLSDRATRSHTISATKVDNSCIRLLSYSNTNKAFIGEDGDLFYFKFRTEWNSPIQTYIANIMNTELANTDGIKIKTSNTDIQFRCYYVPGDANHDKKVSVSDIIADARYILLQNPEPFHYKSANLNDDNEISVSDIVITANIILGRLDNGIKFKMPRVIGGDVLSADVVESRGDGSRTIAIALDNSTDYTAFQADLGLPAGMEITGARLSDRAGRSHSVAMNRIDGNTVRVLSYASDNAVFAGNSGDLLLLDVKGHGNIEMTNALFAEPNGCEHEFDEMTFSTELSGINDITVGNAPVNVYNSAGQLIRINVNPETATQGLPAGFYLVGNKKVVVK